MAKPPCHDDGHPLLRDGTHQKQRQNGALLPENFPIFDLSTAELYALVRAFARQVRFFDFDTALHALPTKDWQVFFPNLTEKELENRFQKANNEPHLALLFAFLKLLEHAKKSINGIPARHLDFYFKEILRLKTRPEQPDFVHVVLEAAKNIPEFLIEKNTLLDGGKDALGNPIFYATVNDFLLNKGKISQISTIYRKNNQIFVAPIANSSDGMGGDFEENESPNWPAFGSENHAPASLGFAISSPILNLKEGRRTIVLTIDFLQNLPNSISENELKNAFSIFLTGEKNWLGEFQFSDVIFSKNRTQLDLVLIINESEKSVSNYRESVHGANFNTHDPILKVVFLSTENHVPVLAALEKTKIEGFKIAISVANIRDLVVEDDFGRVDATRPFKVFGPMPRAGASLYIGCHEALLKNPTSFKIKFDWVNIPADLANYYKGYAGFDPVFLAEMGVLSNAWGSYGAPKPLFAQRPTCEFTHSKNQIAPQKSTPKQEVSHQNSQSKTPNFVVSEAKKTTVETARTEFKSQSLERFVHQGFIRLRSKQSFGYAHFLDKLQANPSVKLAQPLVPEAENLTLDYAAEIGSQRLTDFTESNYKNRQAQFFHLTPFGQSEEHPFLKIRPNFPCEIHTALLPEFKNEGELLIGLSQIEARKTITLLFRLAEGTANSEKISAQKRLKWAVLCQNEWKTLHSQHHSLLGDSTNELLKTGIVTLALPRETSRQNTILAADLVWVRATISSDSDAVCAILDIQTQAVLARYQPADSQNNAHFVGKISPETIQKLVDRRPEIRKIWQPDASFGGRAAELNSDFFTRASERLRHKNRAVSVRDFELLVLQNFPEISKVRCLNHTNPHQTCAPGCLTIVAVPNLQNRAGAQLRLPRNDADTLQRIVLFLEKQSTPFLGEFAGATPRIFAQNADFEEITLDFKVRFHPEQAANFGFWANKLNLKLVSFLSPWMSNSTDADVHFGGRVHKSRVWHFIENQPEVDFIEEIKMFQRGDFQHDLEEAEAQNPRAILVSAANHRILPT